MKKNKNLIRILKISILRTNPPPSLQKWTPLNPERKYVKVARLHLDQYSGRSMHPSPTMNILISVNPTTGVHCTLYTLYCTLHACTIMFMYAKLIKVQ